MKRVYPATCHQCICESCPFLPGRQPTARPGIRCHNQIRTRRQGYDSSILWDPGKAVKGSIQGLAGKGKGVPRHSKRHEGQNREDENFDPRTTPFSATAWPAETEAVTIKTIHSVAIIAAEVAQIRHRRKGHGNEGTTHGNNVHVWAREFEERNLQLAIEEGMIASIGVQEGENIALVGFQCSIYVLERSATGCGHNALGAAAGRRSPTNGPAFREACGPWP